MTSFTRSLYFDSYDECLHQKQSGLLERKKIRFRTYGTGNYAKFEIKRKVRHIVSNDSMTLPRSKAEAIAAGDYPLLQLVHSNPFG